MLPGWIKKIKDFSTQSKKKKNYKQSAPNYGINEAQQSSSDQNRGIRNRTEVTNQDGLASNSVGINDPEVLINNREAVNCYGLANFETDSVNFRGAVAIAEHQKSNRVKTDPLQIVHSWLQSQSDSNWKQSSYNQQDIYDTDAHYALSSDTEGCSSYSSMSSSAESEYFILNPNFYQSPINSDYLIENPRKIYQSSINSDYLPNPRVYQSSCTNSDSLSNPRVHQSPMDSNHLLQNPWAYQSSMDSNHSSQRNPSRISHNSQSKSKIRVYQSSMDSNHSSIQNPSRVSHRSFNSQSKSNIRVSQRSWSSAESSSRSSSSLHEHLIKSNQRYNSTLIYSDQDQWTAEYMTSCESSSTIYSSANNKLEIPNLQNPNSHRSPSDNHKILAAMNNSIATVKMSDNPSEDFRQSMIEMVMERKIIMNGYGYGDGIYENMINTEDAEDLLCCYLSLNSPQHHALIQQVFHDVLISTFSSCINNVNHSAEKPKP